MNTTATSDQEGTKSQAASEFTTEVQPKGPTHNLGIGGVLLLVGSWLVKVWKFGAYAIGSLILALIVLAVVVGLLNGGSGGGAAVNETYVSGSGIEKVAILDMSGVVGASQAGVLEAPSGIGTEAVRADLEQAGQDTMVKAIILRINSPGGSAVVSDEIYDLIADFKATHKKPVVASFGDTAASGGYYIAAAADKIVANPATITGSIGVIMEYYNAAGLMENIGVSSEVIKSGSMKDIGSFSRAATDEERAVLQSVVDGAYGQFVDRVAEGRQMERAKVLELADGRIYTGSQAKETGLVDEVGNLDKAVAVAKNLAQIDEATVVRYDRSGWWQALMSTASKLSPWYGVSELAGDYGMKGQLQYRWKL